MAQITSFIRTTFVLVLISLVTSTFFTASASTQHRTKWTKIENTTTTTRLYHAQSFSFETPAGTGTYTVYASPAMVPAQFNLPDLKPVYIKPANDPKYDNRINGHAQEQLDRLLQQKIIRS